MVSKRRPVGIALGFYISRKQRGSWWVWSLHADANKNTSECSLHDNTGVVVLKAEIHCFTHVVSSHIHQSVCRHPP